MPPCDEKYHLWTDILFRVSILVLMDAALRQIIHNKNIHSISQFQSLFWWMSPCDPTTAVDVGSGVILFQSLFWWMPPCDNTSANETNWVQSVSILVLMDAALRHVWSPYWSLVSSKPFQSLFWWMPPCDLTGTVYRQYSFDCFNPCFDGCRPATSKHRIWFFSVFQFQSLFWWMPPCDSYIMNTPHHINPVSILVLMDAALRRDLGKTLAHSDDSFNPCFDGCRPATTPYEQKEDYQVAFQSLFWWMPPCDWAWSGGTVQCWTVSILVLMDAALRHHAPAARFRHTLVSCQLSIVG